MNKWLLRASVIVAVLSAPLYAAEKPRCKLPGWNSNKPVAAPSLRTDAQWIYTVGENFPLTSLRFSEYLENENRYEVNGRSLLREMGNTYTEVNPRRSGEKITIRFPIHVGDTWEDHFSEPGAFANEAEEYHYDYTEKSHNRVAAVETIKVAAGSFKTLRIVRVAHWVKSNPQSIRTSFARTHAAPTAAEVRVEGITLTQIWYSPDLGRGVMKAQLLLGDTLYNRDTDDLLKYANTAITELSEYRQGSVVCASKPALKARWPESYVPIGYPLRSAFAWERAFELRLHTPRGKL